MTFANGLRARAAIASVLCLASAACGKSADDAPAGSCSVANFSTTALPVSGAAGASPNVMPVTVNGALCRTDAYANQPCVSVTICSPADPTQCQTIDNILLDTGSSGLRIFASAISVPLATIANGAQTLGECVQFADGSSEWGPVQSAYVRLSNEPAVAMSIHAIDSGYASPPGPCTAAQSVQDTDPEQAGYNGILGVSLFGTDCGIECQTEAQNTQYYTCGTGDCSCGATVDLAAQVQNPVSLLPTDNNGVILDLPAITSANGVASLSGNLYLGIDTRANNASTGVTSYPTNSSGNFSTVFAAYSTTAIPSFLDSGSNGLFFPEPSSNELPDCKTAHGDAWAGNYCPASPHNFTAVNRGKGGTPTSTIAFSVGDAYALLTSANAVFANYGGTVPSSLANASFDWGLPFFFGRKTFVGIQGKSSALGTGPYWAY